MTYHDFNKTIKSEDGNEIIMGIMSCEQKQAAIKEQIENLKMSLYQQQIFESQLRARTIEGK